MFQPGHVVRGIDFSDDPLLQGRMFSYLDTQINRHGGPNFEQLPINAPVVPIHNNNRDGAGQMLIHANMYPYSPNSFSVLKQANKNRGRGFFTSPSRRVSGPLTRSKSSTFEDHFTQPRLFFNSLNPTEQQFLINAISFETSQLKNDAVKQNVLTRFNQIDNSIAQKLADVLGMPAPGPDPRFYHDNTTIGVSAVDSPLKSIAGFKVAYLTTSASASSGLELKTSFTKDNITLVVVAEKLVPGVDATYSVTDATGFDGLIIGNGASALLSNNYGPATGAWYPAGRPSQIVLDAYRYGKPVGIANGEEFASLVPDLASHIAGPGVYVYGQAGATGTVSDLAAAMKNGLRHFKFLDRFAAHGL